MIIYNNALGQLEFLNKHNDLSRHQTCLCYAQFELARADKMPATMRMTFCGYVYSSSALLKVILNLLTKQAIQKSNLPSMVSGTASGCTSCWKLNTADVSLVSVRRDNKYRSSSDVVKEKHISNWAVFPLKLPAKRLPMKAEGVTL